MSSPLSLFAFSRVEGMGDGRWADEMSRGQLVESGGLMEWVLRWEDGWAGMNSAADMDFELGI